MEENDVPVRIAVSEQRIKDLNVVVVRVNTAIEKLSEVNTSVSRMLPFMKSVYRNKKRLTLYYLQRLTNSAIKLTSIITISCKEFIS